MNTEKKLRIGILGLGNMGSGHLLYVLEGLCPRAEITAVADTNPDKLKLAEERYPSAARFTDSIALIESGLCDAIIIAVPHLLHPEYAMRCFEKGIHVFLEKPAGVYTRQVREMNEAAIKSGLVFAIDFNQRTNPLFAKAREIVQSGRLGVPKRLVWIVTNWYRTQAYYDSGSWRASWNGEGGGILLNQAPHNLDLWQWIFGMPKRIRAFCTEGKYHNITVEDDATIYAEYENGAVATFITTTGEAPGTNRLEISGDLGKIVIENGTLKWWKLTVPERELCFSSKEGFIVPETTYEEFTAEEPDGHPIQLNNFIDAVLDGTPLLAPGIEGLNALQISNAAFLSSWTGDFAVIGENEALFEQLLEEHRAAETAAKAAAAGDTGADSAKTGVKKDQTKLENLRERWKTRW